MYHLLKNATEDYVEKSYIGTKWADDVEDFGRNTLDTIISGIDKASQDQEGWTDDALRGIGTGAKWVGQKWKEGTADQEGIGDDILRGVGFVGEQGLRLADAASYYGGKAGGKLAETVGIDPRIGGAIGNIAGDVLAGGVVSKVGKVGALKGAHQLIKHDLPGSDLASRGLQRHYAGKAADLNKSRLRKMKQQVGGQSEAMRRGELNLQGLMSNLDSAMWQSKYSRLPDVKSREAFLKKGFGKDLKDFYVEGGKITPKALAKDPDTMQKLMDRADKIVEGFAKGDQRKLYDTASWNIFEESKEVYGQGGLVKKIQAAFLGVQGKEWHHMFGNKEAGEFLLNKVAQDPVVAANLFKHMEKLGIKSGAIAENMALMRKAPHNSWHRFMEDMGIEPRVKMKSGETLKKLEQKNLLAQQSKKGEFVPHELRTSKSTGKNRPWKYTAPLDVSDFGHEIAQGILQGTTDVNELFSFLTVYHKKYVPWMKQQLKDPKYAAQFLSEVPEGPEKALLLGLYKSNLGTRGRKVKKN
jgi:hypothetical protein